MTRDQVLVEVVDEARVAQEKFGDYASLHEAYGVLAEEVSEFFAAVCLRQEHPGRTHQAAREAIQIAAVAIRIAEQAERLTR